MTLLSRLEKLERESPGVGRPDHIVSYMMHKGDDEARPREAAVAQYRAEHETKPDDVFGFVCMRIVSPGDRQ